MNMSSARRDTGLLAFGQKVRQVRKLAGYSQQELAMLMNFSGSGTISQVENGQIGLELRNIIRLAEVLGIRVEILINSEAYNNAEMRKHLRYYEIMHNPNHPMRPALDAILSMPN